jgi:NTE family protein
MSAGIPLGDAGTVLGTSAGAVVGAWLTLQPDGVSSVPALMRQRALQHADNHRSGRVDHQVFERAIHTLSGSGESRAPGGGGEVTTPPVTVEQAEATWKPNLPDGRWPTNLAIASVHQSTGRPRVWSASDNISVPVAVACSTAAPGVAPPVAVHGTVYVDGGVRSGTNADLLLTTPGGHFARGAGPGTVLMFVPLPDARALREQTALLAQGFNVCVITAHPFYTTPIQLLDAAFIDLAVSVGAEQAAELAGPIASWLAG